LSSIPSSPEGRFETAEKLEERGEYAAALDEWRTLASDHPHAETYFRLGNLAKQVGRIDEAEQAFRNAIQTDDRCAAAHANLALILSDESHYEDAEKHLRKALTYEKSAPRYCVLGTVLGALDRKQEAIECYKTALALEPDYEEAHYNLAVDVEETDPLLAEQHLLKAIEFDPNYSAAHRELGWVLSGQNDHARAEYHLRRAIELDGNDAWARIYLGNLLWKLGDIAAGEMEFQKAIEIRPNQSYPYWSLANLYENQEQWEKAEKFYERALEIDPDDEVAHMNFGRMLKASGDRERAISHLERALALNPKYSKAQELLASIGK
jgi:protein O-GlcNAc transferase